MKTNLDITYPAICSSCCNEINPKMMTGYSIEGECYRCGRLGDLSIVERMENA